MTARQHDERPPAPLEFEVCPVSDDATCGGLACGEPVAVSVALPGASWRWRFCAGCWLTLYTGLCGRPHRVVFQ